MTPCFSTRNRQPVLDSAARSVVAGCVFLACHASAAEPPQGKYPVSASPFREKPAESYSDYKDAQGNWVYPIWGQAPFFDFGTRPVKMDPQGVATVPQAPPAGIHPRILFGPDQLADVRRRVKETKAGQEAWKNILSWTEAMKGTYDDTAEYAKPDRFNGGFQGLRGRVDLFRLGLPKNPQQGVPSYRDNPAAAAIYDSLADGTAEDFPAFYWNVFPLEAFRCLIEEDREGARKVAGAVTTALRITQAKRDAERAAKQAKTPNVPLPPIDQPAGTFQLAFSYDFLFNDLTKDQRQAIEEELRNTTWSHDNYGTFNTAETSRSNWATFSYWLYQVLAIEGQPGFNDLKVRGMFRGWRNLLTYGWFPSGATFEGEAKNQVGMDGVLLFAARQNDYGFENLAAHPYLRAYAGRFLPHSLNPMLTGFHKYDLLGGSRAASAGFAPMDAMGFKYAFPDDKVVDFVYRKSIGENYENIPHRPDGYYNALLYAAVFAEDFDPANNDPAKLGLGNTFFCGERSLLMTRTGWDPNATMLNLHTRGANGGHPFADRNGIMVAGAGRVWSPNGYANFKSDENSLVVIDGASQDRTVPGRMIAHVDEPMATFAVGDAKYAWDWTWRRLQKRGGFYTKEDITNNRVEIPPGFEPVMQTPNDFALTKHPYAYLNRPLFELGDWILPSGALSPMVRAPYLPVQRAFRTAGLIRGQHPYILVVDDIQKNDDPARYDWGLLLEYDVQMLKLDQMADGQTDILLWGSDPNQTAKRPAEALPGVPEGSVNVTEGEPMLLVRVLNRNGEPIAPEIVERPNQNNPKKYPRVRRLVIPSQSPSPDFKVLLYPHRLGDPLPETKWNADRTAVTVRFPDDQTDEIRFTKGGGGKTHVQVARNGTVLAKVDQEPPPPLP